MISPPDLDILSSYSPSHPACSALRTYCAIALITCISPHSAGMSSAAGSSVYPQRSVYIQCFESAHPDTHGCQLETITCIHLCEARDKHAQILQSQW